MLHNIHTQNVYEKKQRAVEHACRPLLTQAMTTLVARLGAATAAAAATVAAGN
jgi:hypothetical protein